jgi:predicted nucleic acid-binding Zn ribbon protein
MRIKKNEFTLEEALKLWKENASLSFKVSSRDIIENWRAIVGDIIANQTQSVSIHQNTLFLKVLHPLWKKELSYQSEYIKNLVNQFANAEVIHQVVVS